MRHPYPDGHVQKTGRRCLREASNLPLRRQASATASITDKGAALLGRLLGQVPPQRQARLVHTVEGPPARQPREPFDQLRYLSDRLVVARPAHYSPSVSKAEPETDDFLCLFPSTPLLGRCPMLGRSGKGGPDSAQCVALGLSRIAMKLGIDSLKAILPSLWYY